MARGTNGWLLGLTAAASLMVALDATVVTTALTRIRLDLSATLEQLEWTVNAYNLTFAALLMTGAALGDRFGRRRMFAGGLGLFTAASAACALAPGIGWLIAARAVQGAGAALIMPLAMALLSNGFPPERRAKALGIFAGLTGLAVVAGPVVGGIVTEGLAWQWIFWLNVPIGLVVIPLVLRRVPESRGAGAAFDLGGVVLVTGGALGLVWGLIRAGAVGWDAFEVVGALAAGAALLAAFVAWELRVRQPMVPMRLLRSRGFSAGNAAGLFMYASLYGSLFFMAQFIQSGLGHGPMATGLRLVPWTATVTVVAPLAGTLVNRVGSRTLTAAGLTMQAAGMGWIGLVAEPSMAYAQLIAPMVLAGAGVSMAMPAAQTSVINAVAPQEIGKASGVFNTLRQFAAVFGVAILAVVFTARGGYGTAQTFTDGFAATVAASGALSLAGALASLAIPRRSRTVPARATAAVAARAPRTEPYAGPRSRG
ncbi:DHA2 family efflux MFS transporter permease subunit [Actinomadura spongiicola]|uniref:DHA2 family efflux MFS transporter permease subunit n=1 Tax=Actinomadura spongiicola TaxID=2303421 RepID=A0A372GCS2_9ACTN|nr:MFS transporter [Actinomadura spongiicola]RFS83185.1 DHA2 family efflux MFS transporter permease subunit [Actinomadura spongiicola]